MVLFEWLVCTIGQWWMVMVVSQGWWWMVVAVKQVMCGQPGAAGGHGGWQGFIVMVKQGWVLDRYNVKHALSPQQPCSSVVRAHGAVLGGLGFDSLLGHSSCYALLMSCWYLWNQVHCPGSHNVTSCWLKFNTPANMESERSHATSWQGACRVPNWI